MADVSIHPECPFSVETFEVLAKLKNSTEDEDDFYLEYEEEFKKCVEKPLQELYRHLAAQLPGGISKRLDINCLPILNYKAMFYNISARAVENKRNSANFFLTIVKEELRFGLFITERSPDKQRFIKNYQDNIVKEIILQKTQLTEDYCLHCSSKKDLDKANLLGDWLRYLARKNSANKNIQISIHLKPEQVLSSSKEHLINQIKQTFEGLFPLFLLATSDKPEGALREYLNPSMKKWGKSFLDGGIIKYQAQNYQDAITEFSIAIEKAPNLANAYSYRGQAKAELGDIEGAILDYNQLLLIQINNSDGYYNRGNAYYKLEDYEAAIQDYNQTLKINPNFALAYYQRGCAYFELENKQQAIEDFHRVLELLDKEEDMDHYDEQLLIIRERINSLLPIPESTLLQVVEQTSFDETELIYWLRAINRKKQAIFQGSPGTGKTYIADKLAKHLISGTDGFLELLQLHPAYSYEDFIQGIRPQSQDGKLTYPLIPGRFLEFCKKAESRQGLCVLIIDEINRANLAQVFGELMYLLEYRNKKIRLSGSNELFSIPENVRIIGTMNTADRSIALVDHALRRRFAFIELRPNYQVLKRYHEKHKTGFPVDGLIEMLKHLNNAIANKHYEIGISFFLTENLSEQIEDIWKMEIEPYLEEYFFDQLEKADEFCWVKIKQNIVHE
ncbi:MAG: tetratricopeptide repeat protein [Coleofasciculaceae cyanobacterium]